MNRPELSAPLYGASFPQAIARFWKKYATFRGRASRSEFWFAVLFQVIVVAVLYGGMMATLAATSAAQGGGGIPSDQMPVIFWILLSLLGLFVLATIIPGIAITVRRLHDANYTGWLYLLNLTSIGGIVVLIFTILPSNPEGARFD